MGVLVSLTVGLVLWIVLWALGGAKPFDAFLPAVFLVVIAAAAQIAKPYIEKLIKP